MVELDEAADHQSSVLPIRTARLAEQPLRLADCARTALRSGLGLWLWLGLGFTWPAVDALRWQASIPRPLGE